MLFTTVPPALDTTALQHVNVLLYSLSLLHAGAKAILETEAWRHDLDALMVHRKAFHIDSAY